MSAIALGLTGVMVGSGVASTAIGVTDGVTWLGDRNSGEILQYNPSTGIVEQSVRVAEPGADVVVVQHNGMLALKNKKTGGEITTFDLRTLTVGGQRTGAEAKVLMGKGGRMYVADAAAGTITRIDPVTATDLGTPVDGEQLRRGAALIDAVADESGTVWAASGTAGSRRSNGRTPARVGSPSAPRTPWKGSPRTPC